MRELGISIYPDLLETDTLEQYIMDAASNGFTRAFTSLTLKELNFCNAKDPRSPLFAQAISFASRNNIKVTADINAEIMQLLGCTPQNIEPLHRMGVFGVRIDGGLTNDEIATVTRNPYGIAVEINASDMLTPFTRSQADILDMLDCIRRMGNTDNLIACFNFYPRTNTGLRLGEMTGIIDLLKSNGIAVSAFVASQVAPSILHKPSNGVPTVEAHRYIAPEYAAQELFGIGVDCVLLGDVQASLRELTAMSRLSHSDCNQLPVVYNAWVPDELKTKLHSYRLVSRDDQPEQVIRATDSRGLVVEPCCCGNRKRYSVTVDNTSAFQYHGELQIMLDDLGADCTVNVLGHIHQDAWGIVPQLKYAKAAFCLTEWGK